MDLISFFAGVMDNYRAAQGIEADDTPDALRYGATMLAQEKIPPEPENTYDPESELSQALSKIEPLRRDT